MGFFCRDLLGWACVPEESRVGPDIDGLRQLAAHVCVYPRDWFGEHGNREFVTCDLV